TENWEMAEQAMDLNFYISFSGIVTFKNAEQLREIAKLVPLERMLLETDAPYLAPVPHRGKPNEPAYVRHIAEYIAELRGISYQELAVVTSNNFMQLFDISSNLR
ncbi:MAG: TatD family hydrolase, partial [Gammaproteobacteria bacterium]|nr:TatD family hydrolase [Gammaproteobacteria bacterium]